MGVLKLITKNPISLWVRWLICKFQYQRRFHNKKLSIRYMASLRDCQFGLHNTVYDLAELNETTLGDFSYVGPRSRITRTEVGKFTCIGPDVIVGLGNHPAHNFVSTHPAFFSTHCQAGFTFVSSSLFDEYEKCKIGNDVWIGARAIVLDGLSIGNGAIIGAGAVVTKDVPAFAVVVGVPAKILRYRFEQSKIEYLEEFKWWDRDVEWLQNNHKLFTDIAIFSEHST
jgi:acetyltransferase-like isoleucine patch superfamily enzyme